MISRFRVHRDLEFRKSKTGKVSTFDSRSWEPRTHPRTPLSHQNKPERHARLSGWERARKHWEAGSLNCQKRIIKKDCREGSAGPCSISPVFNRVWGGIISFEFVTIVTTIKGEEVLIYHLWTLPAYPAPSGTIPSYRKDQVDVAPNRRCDRCRCFTLN